MFTLYIWYIRTIFVYVIFTVFTFRQKNFHIYPKKYLKYNVRKGMVGRSEDVPRRFECLVGKANVCTCIWKSTQRTNFQSISYFAYSFMKLTLIYVKFVSK